MQALHHPNSNSSLTASNQHQVSTSSEAEEDDNDSHPKSDTSQKSPTGFSSIGSPVGSLASPLTPNQVSTVFVTFVLTLFPLEGVHGVSLHIQIISFQIWIELHG